MQENKLQKVLKSYQKRLTNLTSRNKSLLLPNLSAEQFLDIHEFDFLQNKPSFNVIEQLIAQKNTISLCEILSALTILVIKLLKIVLLFCDRLIL